MTKTINRNPEIHKGHFRKRGTKEIYRVARIVHSVPFFRTTGRNDGSRVVMLQLFLADGRTEDITREYARSVNLVLGGYLIYHRKDGWAYVAKEKFYDYFTESTFDHLSDAGMSAMEKAAEEEYRIEQRDQHLDTVGH